MAIVTSTERNAYLTVAKGVSLSAPWLAFLDMIQPWVEKAVEKVVGYKIEQTSFTEFLPAAGGERPPVEFGVDIGFDLIGGMAVPRSRVDPAGSVLQLSRLPARSIVSVYENLSAWSTGAANGYWPASSLLPAQTYRLDFTEPGISPSGRLIRVVGAWSSTPRSVKVTYTAGVSEDELGSDHSDYKLAVLEGISFWMARGLRGSSAIKSNGYGATNVAIRDFSATLNDPSAVGQGAGAWAANILGPNSMAILMGHVNMAKYI